MSDFLTPLGLAKLMYEDLVKLGMHPRELKVYQQALEDLEEDGDE